MWLEFVIMMQRSNVIALKVQNSYKQSFGAKVQRRSVQSRSDLQSKRRVERLYWRLLPGSDKVVVSYCWAELGLQMVMVKIRNDHDYKYKERVATPKQMNSRKSSKRPLTPPPHFGKLYCGFRDKIATKVRMFIWRDFCV